MKAGYRIEASYRLESVATIAIACHSSHLNKTFLLNAPEIPVNIITKVIHITTTPDQTTFRINHETSSRIPADKIPGYWMSIKGQAQYSSVPYLWNSHILSHTQTCAWVIYNRTPTISPNNSLKMITLDGCNFQESIECHRKRQNDSNIKNGIRITAHPSNKSHENWLHMWKFRRKCFITVNCIT